MICGKALDYLLDLEGFDADHPADRGGRTRWGVTQKSYDRYRKSKGKEPRSVEFITPDELSEFYRDEYWLPAGYGLVNPLDFCVFQFGVLAGPARSVKLLQAVLGVKADGICGPATKYSAEQANKRCVVDEHIAGQRAHVDRIVERDGSQKAFIKGWHNRFDKVHRICLEERR